MLLRRTYALVVSNVTDTDYIASTLGNALVYPGEARRLMATVRIRTR